ncbi:hypothetical protein UMM65_13570 [Aureibaculum sp. 2210JD6-5]|uniref:hypothetical protein n=1 Tax=Aureibaculum sp. 2210JD6-5 TaxID=3103957 RepID=UPI002AAC6533|nr:hypothetical protein [Aureibaculum sp. 2210JD6-5]MDY7396274.1 hypothetical protein [Aureibaculum sp. 2210JD6-5]
MKNVIRKSLVIVLMFATMFSYANEFAHTIEKNKDEITHLAFKNVTEGSVLTIKDFNGLILYKEIIEKAGEYSKEFNLTALPNGNYLFELDKTFEIKIIPFKVNNNQVVFDKEKESIIFKPTVIAKDGIVKIHSVFLNNKPLNVKFYYENGDLIYSENIENKQILNKVYDFTTSLKGNYRIVFNNDKRTFVENVKI